jgi:type IV pilus assembly protein PilV
MHMTNASFTPRRFGMSGFTMVEMLVALVILSVGMLGIAGLYVTTLRTSNTAIFRTLAVNLAADMADRIRANPNAGDAYEGAAADKGCVDPAATCSRADMAADDLFWWQDSLQDTLPDDGNAGTPQGTVTVDGAAPLRTYTIRVNWVDPSEPGPLTYTLTMQI